MYDEIVPLVVVLGISAIYLLNWRTSLKKRAQLQEMVLEVIENKARSQAAKELAVTFFVMSGKHFVVFSYLNWMLTAKFRSILGLKSNVETSTKKQKMEKSLKRNEMNKVVFPIIKKSMEINAMLSPIQYFLAFLLIAIGKAYAFFARPNSKSSKVKAKTHVAHALLNYSERRV
ncbi:hypothetical protein MOU97_004171 [Vibrio vulnificus]|jgi:hypothetical protein|uniref:hypothetical protein n=1 Tax=Vibrio TaxID=662 RepID=UPI00159386DD|nr:MULTISPECIES: hypothetical protein [Vibrio]EIV1777491.1 hypothetical protein [Vibrio vulnificus]EIZ0992016.1 hypothetical protein [Vibrio vulnificus]ELX4148836.1 hypothetical protein [Vibrio vulnificus]MBE3659017.1 hypothetical protein [Vibrio navarrensis]MDE1236834.1 hypothetical protein [Vibrio aestuarianus]